MASQELQTILEMFKSQPVAQGATLADQRAGLDAMATMNPLPSDVVCTKVDANGVPAEWIDAPGCDPARAVLYVHGGGYVIGLVDSHQRANGQDFARRWLHASCRSTIASRRRIPSRLPSTTPSPAIATCWSRALHRPPSRLPAIPPAAASPSRRSSQSSRPGWQCPARPSASPRGSTSKASESR